jgi:exodeoxyribonuclease V alpha subunit
MDNTTQITGVIEKLLFSSNESGFVVLVLTVSNQKITVTGHIPNAQAGQHISVTGQWQLHAKFGKQLVAKQCTIHAPTSIIGLKKYLGSGLIKGIGPVYAEKLVDYFGTQVLDIIDNETTRLSEVPGIGLKRVEIIARAWQDQKAISHIMVFLQEKGISSTFATKIYKHYGMNAVTLITENPYRLADDLWGVGFKTADQIALNIGFAPNSLKRITAGIVYAITNHISTGNLYALLDDIKTKTVALLSLDHQDTLDKIKIALHDLYNQQKISLLSYDNKHFITKSQYYLSEKGVAHKILKLIGRPSDHSFNLDELYTQLRTNTDQIALNDDQIRSIITCLQHRMTVITGGPGTGKTTLIKQLLHILDTYKCSYKLAAPTGRAAKRMFEGTGRPASTIHRLLEFDVNSMGFARNEQNALQLDFLIVDEASMIDIFLAHALLRALPSHARIILIGDVDQLPSVGAGNFLHDIIASNTVPCIRLTHIFRQAQDSMIIRNAHRVNNGEFPTMDEDARRDFIFIKEQDAGNTAAHLQNIFTNGLRTYGIAAADAIVLTPMNRGIVGTQQINHHLQQIINTTHTDQQIAFGSITFKLHDRVMQIRNNYDKLIFNGDIGTIDSINIPDKELVVRFLDRPIEYDFSELDELTLAYAITIHKSQGSEYPAVIIPLFMQHYTLLQRNLLYTGITRAKKLCILIGQPKAIGMAINNTKGLERITFLQQYLTSDLQCR